MYGDSRGEERMVIVLLHNSENNISLIPNRSKSHRRDHNNHEIKCLNIINISLDTSETLSLSLSLSKHSKARGNECVHTQLADVDNAFAGARIRKGTISAG